MSDKIAEYFASLRFKPDTASLKQVDTFFKRLESKINTASKKVANGTQISGIAGSVKGVKAVEAAEKKRSTSAVKNIQNESAAKVKALKLENQLEAENLRKRALAARKTKMDAAASLGVEKAVRYYNPTKPRQSSVSGGGMPSTPRMGFGGVGGVWGAVAGASIGGMTLGTINKAVRELEMLPVALEAVTGSAARAREELAWMDKLGNETGTTLRQLAPEYTKFLASAIGTPLEQDSKGIFRSTIRYGKVIGMDKEAVKGTLKAMTQIAN